MKFFILLLALVSLVILNVEAKETLQLKSSVRKTYSQLRIRHQMKHKVHAHHHGDLLVSNKKQPQRLKETLQNEASSSTSMPPQEAVAMKEAWASSVYTYRSWWWSFAYHAHNPLRWGLWLSKFQGYDSKQVVTWEAFLQNYNLLEAVSIFWRFAPGECEIQTSPDGGTTWQIQRPMENCKWDPIANLGLARWQMWRYMAFQKRYLFPQPAFTKKLRILMKDAIYGYYGIIRVAPLVRGYGYAFQFKNTDDTSGDNCMSILNGDYNPGTSVIVQDCSDAILNSDGRELFIFHSQSMRIWSLISGLAIGVDDQGQIPQVQLQYPGNKQNDKWTMSATGKIQSNLIHNKCLGRAKDQVNLKDLDFQAIATSEIWGGNNQPQQAISGGESDSWISRPGIQENTFEVNFEPISIDSFTLNWVDGKIARKFEVSIKFGKYWKVIFSNIVEAEEQDENDEGNVQVNFALNSMTYSGVKIYMVDGEGTENDAGTDKIVYGIKSITIVSNIWRLEFKDCDEESDTNKWEIYDINFFDIQTKRQYLTEKKFLMQDYEALMFNIVKLKDFHDTIIEQMIITGGEIKRLIEQVQNDIDILEVNYVNFKAILKIPIVGDDAAPRQVLKIDGVKGSAYTRPANNCYDLKKEYPHKKSGYYWIQGGCQTIPNRLFCDFVANTDLLYVGSIQKNIVWNDKVDSPQQFKNECAKYGLYPVEILNLQMLKSIVGMVQNYNTQIQDQEVIPLLMDYSCSYGDCTGAFQSFNNQMSPVVTDLVTKLKGNWQSDYMNDSNNILVLNDEMKFVFKQLSFGLKVKGLICSRNYNPKYEQSRILDIDCETTMNTNLDFEGSLFTQFNVKCPAGCINKQKSPVVGSMIYKDDSPICLAGVQQGIYKDQEGGFMTVTSDAGRQEYMQGDDKSGVQCSSWKGTKTWERSFVLNSYKKLCPQGFMVDGVPETDGTKLSFIEKKSTIHMRHRNRGHLEDGQDQNKKEENKDDKQGDKKGDKKDEQGEQQAGSDPSKSAENDSKEEEGLEKQPLTTTTSIQKIQANMKSEDAELNSLKKVTIDINQILSETQLQFNPLQNSDISSVGQLHDINTLENNMNGIKAKIDYQTQLAGKKSQRFKHRKTEFKLQIMRLKEFEKFQEEFISDKPEDVWDTFSIKSSKGGKPIWTYQPQLFGVSNSLGITNNVQLPGQTVGYAVYQILQNRLYYDFIFRASFNIAQEGTIAYVFRYIDSFNYYAFEVTRKNDKGFIRVVKMQQGFEVTLAQDNQGGAMMSTWYDVQITTVQRSITIKWSVHAPSNMPNDDTYGPQDDTMPVAFEIKDGEFIQGTVGFAVNGCTKGASFTRIQVQPSTCSDPNLQEQGTLFVPVDGSRYKEDFQGQFTLKYDYFDPVGAQQGPSKWEFEQKNFKGKKAVLRQKSLVNGADHLGTIAVLKLNKVLRLGAFVTNIYLQDNLTGWAGLVFMLGEQSNYFILELGEECKVAKVIDGHRKFLRKNPHCTLSAGQWYRVHLVLYEKSIKVLLGTTDDNLKVVLDYEGDLPVEGGPVGFLTYKQLAAFTNIEIIPESDYIETVEEQQYDKETPNAVKGKGNDAQDNIENDGDFEIPEGDKENNNDENENANGENENSNDENEDSNEQKEDENENADGENEGQDKKTDGENKKNDSNKKDPMGDIQEAPKVDYDEDLSNEQLGEQEGIELINSKKQDAKNAAKNATAKGDVPQKEVEALEAAALEAENSQVCLTSPTQSSHVSFCEKRYSKFPGAYNKCVGKEFCDVCCSTYIDGDQKPDAQKTCKEECSANQVADDSLALWSQCTNKEAESKVYSFCENKPENQVEKCKIDMCEMCCTSTTAIFGVDVDDAQTNQCIAKCNVIFDPNYVEPATIEEAIEEEEETIQDEIVTPTPAQEPEAGPVDCNVGFKECVHKEGCSWNVLQFKCENNEKDIIDNLAQDGFKVADKVTETAKGALNIAEQVATKANDVVQTGMKVADKVTETAKGAFDMAGQAASQAKKFFGWRMQKKIQMKKKLAKKRLLRKLRLRRLLRKLR